MYGNVNCPHCGSEITNDGSLAGRVVSCPGCALHFQMPTVPVAQVPVATAAASPDALGFLDNPSASPASYSPTQNWGYAAPPPKNSGIAAVLSFFWPGLGQIYNGQIGKGICFLLLHVVFVLMIFILIGIPLVFILWVVSIYDAYQQAEEINAKAVRRRF